MVKNQTIKQMFCLRAGLLAIILMVNACNNSGDFFNISDGISDGTKSGINYGYYAESDSYWWDTDKPLTVCFEDYSNLTHPQEAQWIKEAILESWGTYSGLEYTGWNSCPASAESCSSEGQCLRLKIVDDGDFSAFTNGLGKKNNNFRANMQFSTRMYTKYDYFFKGNMTHESLIKSNAIHEFGHAIGMIHEQNRDETDFDDVWIPQGDVIFDFISLFIPLDFKKFGPYDRESIMNYNYFSSFGNSLSYGDILTARQMYGHKAPDEPKIFVIENGRQVHDGTPDLSSVVANGPPSAELDEFGKAIFDWKYDWKYYNFFETFPGDSRDVELKIDNLGGKEIELIGKPQVKIAKVMKESAGNSKPIDTVIANSNSDGTKIFSIVRQPESSIVRPQEYADGNGYNQPLPFTVRFHAVEKGTYAAKVVIPYRYYDQAGGVKYGKYAFHMQAVCKKMVLLNANEHRIMGNNFKNKPGSYSKSLIDVNSDGSADLVMQSTGEDGWDAYISINNGDGTFRQAFHRTLLSMKLSNDQSRYTKLNGDIDSDGDIDLILQSTDNFGWHSCVALNTCSNGECSDENIFKEGKVQTLRSGVYGLFFDRFTKLAGDVNGDGRTDLLLQTTDNNGWRAFVALSNGDGTFKEGTKQSIRSGDYGIIWDRFTKLLGDIDGDGDMDIIMQTTDETSGWRGFAALNNCRKGSCGNGDIFQQGLMQTLWDGANKFSFASDRYEKIMADVNNDGYGDLIMQTTDTLGYLDKNLFDLYARGWRVFIALGNGDGTFRKGYKEVPLFAHFGQDPKRFSKHIADFNGDGNLDVMLQTADRWQILLAFGKGNGTFAPALKRTLMPGAFTTDYTAFSTCIGDVNADGRIDVVLQQNDSNAWLEHDALYNSDF